MDRLPNTKLTFHRTKLPRLLQCLAFATFACIISALPTFAAAGEQPVRIQLRWLHQFQFAGYYQAIEQGYFAEAGLKVELLEGGPNALRAQDAVLKGDVEFAISSSGVVMSRLEGQPVVAVAAIMQTSPLVWVTMADSGITTPQDLMGKRLMTMPPPESAELLTVLRKEGLSISNLQLIPTTFNIMDLVAGKVDAYDAYVSNEPYDLKQQGYKFNLINPRDYGINFYSDVLITAEALATQEPELVIAVRDAVLRGWAYAFEHPEATAQLIQEKYAPEKTLDHLLFEAEQLRSLVMPDLVAIGHMNPGRWDMIARSYSDLGMTTGSNSLEGFIFNEPKRNIQGLLMLLAGALALLIIAAVIITRFIYLSRRLRSEIEQRKSAEAELKKLNSSLQRLSITDPLTGIYNRRGFADIVNRAMSRATRERTELALLALDLDHFKQVNDTHGHPVGDQVLVSFVQLLQSIARPYDTLGRLGGEEFAILIERVDLATATKIAERIRQETEHLSLTPVGAKQPVRITVSIGITTNQSSVLDIWRGVDEALYQAKNSGRNRVVVI